MTEVHDRMANTYNGSSAQGRASACFSRPFTRVLDIGDVGTGDFEFSIPLSVLGLSSTPGETLRGDLGLLREELAK